MDIINGLGIGSGAEILLIAVLCYGFVTAIKRTSINNAWLPWVSGCLGIVCGIVAGLFLHEDIFGGAILGLIIGFAVSGIYDGFTGLPSVFNKEVK